MSLSQLFIGSLILFVIYRTIVAYRQKSLAFGFALVWLLFWIFGLTLVVMQEWTVIAARGIGIGRGVDLVIYISLIIIFYLIYVLFARLQKLEKDTTRIVRKIALDNYSRKRK